MDRIGKVEKIKMGEISAEENIEGFLKEIERKNKKYNVFIDINHNAIEDAKKIDKKIEKGKKVGRIAGLGVAVKSNINVEGLLATCASKTLENYVSTYDAEVIKRIKREDGVILGMTNMDEFACGSSGETSFFGCTKNPVVEDRIPGGSSSGSAAAVALQMCDFALGSDTGGSIRNPASHCGVVGIKPTYGLVPRTGLIDMAMSLDQIGTFGKTVMDAALLLDVISGYYPYECTSFIGNFELIKHMKKNIEGMKIGYAKEFDELTIDKRIERIVKDSLGKLEKVGAEVIDISLPHLEVGLPTYYLIVFVEFFSATRKYDGRRYGYRIEDVCGSEVLRRIMLGSYISQKEYRGKYYKKALIARSLIRKELISALKNVDVLVGPTVPKLPHRVGEKVEPLEMYSYDYLTVPANLAGIPAGVVKGGEVNGIPVGIQVQAKHFDEVKMLDVMYAIEVSS